MKTGKWFMFLFVMFGTYFAIGQKYAYIDSDYILKKMPEYQDSKEKLDKLADRWTKEKRIILPKKKFYFQKKKRTNVLRR
jgi:outer membrane protein